MKSLLESNAKREHLFHFIYITLLYNRFNLRTLTRGWQWCSKPFQAGRGCWLGRDHGAGGRIIRFSGVSLDSSQFLWYFLLLGAAFWSGCCDCLFFIWANFQGKLKTLQFVGLWPHTQGWVSAESMRWRRDKVEQSNRVEGRAGGAKNCQSRENAEHTLIEHVWISYALTTS